MPDIRSGSAWKINYVDLGIPRPKIARILMAQMHSHAGDYIRRDGLSFLSDIQNAKESLERILAKAREYTCDLVLLPELSVPLKCIDIAQDWSKSNSAIVIAGSHYFKRRQGQVARCPIMVGGTVYFSEKITPAPAEVSAILGQGLTPGREISIFRNSVIGTFAALICSDYLSHDILNAINLEEIDVLCVPSFQRSSDAYHSRMSIQCEEHSSGIYILYGNNVCDDLADGRSAIFAQMDNLFIQSLRDAGLTNAAPPGKIVELTVDHSYVIAELDFQHKKAFAKRTVDTRPNVQIVKVEKRPDVITEKFAKAIGREDDRYARITDFYIPPREYEEILDILERKHIVFIVGDPGIGKTYTAVRILRHYFEKNYSPSWYAGSEREERVHQRQLLESFVPEPSRTFYFEDPFGRTIFEKRDSVRKVLGPLIDALRDVDARVVITSRHEIFAQFSHDSSGMDLKEFTQNLTVINPSYSDNALHEIVEKLALRAAWYQDLDCRALVEQQIAMGKLATPLAVRDFVFSTWNTSDIKVLMERFEGRRREEKSLFAEDVISCDTNSKLALALVFLSGHQPVATLTHWFNRLATEFLPERKWSGTEPLFEILRRQGGYRLETYGLEASIWRFSHPHYEEAFASAAVTDATTWEVLKNVIRVVGAASPSEAINSIDRLSKKHSTLGPRMVRELAILLRDAGVTTHLCHLGLQCLALHSHFRDSGYLDILREALPLEDLVIVANREMDLTLIGHALRLAFHYSRVEAREMQLTRPHRKSVSSQVDWNHLYDLWSGIFSWKTALESFEWAVQIDRSKVLQFLKTVVRTELYAKISDLTPNERQRFLNVTPPIANVNAVLERLRRVEGLQGQPSKAAGIIINSGALSAMEKKRNLLPVGIVDVIGTFERNEIISVFVKGSEKLLAFGRTAYSSDEVRLIMGLHSRRIEFKLGYSRGRAVIREASIKLAENG